MIPLIYISASEKEAEKIIADAQKKNAVAPYNIHTVKKEGQGLKIEHVREIISLLINADSQARIIAIYDFETASQDVQNALLKTLEECPEETQIILFCADDSTILPTILSRSTLVYSTSVKKDSVRKKYDIASLKEMLKSIEVVTADQAKHIFMLYVRMIEERITEETDSEKLVLYASLLRDLQETAQLVEKNNVNPQLAVDHILFRLYNHGMIS